MNGVPLGYFNAAPDPDLIVSSDASDNGVCTIVPSLRLALSYQFVTSERRLVAEFKAGASNDFDINYRELLACASVIHTWTATWGAALPQTQVVHIHFRIDNQSAVSWQAKMASRNHRAQVIGPLMGAWE
ncbi:hypothetical protein ON010_g13307 [Phytophthora cinnamomi]|nr:hypothetical protein ON010_g13307 [Phytophthora cinnamomi]